MSRRENKEKKQSSKICTKILVVLVFIVSIVYVLKYAGNYVRDDIEDQTNLVINNSNVTDALKKPIYIEKEVIYISKEDVSNFFDEYIYYDEKYNQIITGTESRIASIVIGENKMTDNGSTVNISGSVIEKNDTYYVPFSEMNNIYNVKCTYVQETDTVILESLNKKLVVADSNKKNSVKAYPTAISRTVDKLDKGEIVTLVLNSDTNTDGWIKVRTNIGKIGYVKENTITNKTVVREDLNISKKMDTKISLVWEYFSEYGEAPSRTEKLNGVNVVSPTFFTLKKLGKGEINENVGESGKNYINWAHSSGYKVWANMTNDSMIETTSEIMNDYKLRQDLISKIVSVIMKYNLDGINIDFENMYEKDKNLFSRFIIELAPRLKEIGATLSVDVTAPDGSSEWSMCYDRHTIGKVADYIIFMAYDQNGMTEVGTTAGHDWIKVSLDKFVGTQEEVDADKIILGIPFYTRIWWQNSSGENESEAVDIKDLNEIIPANATKNWDDSLKQYVTEYVKNGVKYKVWIEDEKSIEAKLDLIKEYGLSGAAFWKKGGEQESIWDLVIRKLGI